jgi:hypothetical protein
MIVVLGLISVIVTIGRAEHFAEVLFSSARHEVVDQMKVLT